MSKENEIHLEKLKDVLIRSADHVDEHGHHQFDMWEGKACCIMGAPRMVDHESSYSHILRDVLAYLGYDEVWNDTPERTKQEVVDALRGSVHKITPELMQSIYGPRWRAILDFIVSVDNWDQDRYTEIQKSELDFEYAPEYSHENPNYLNGLVSYLATIMTSGKALESTPFKKLFDRQYKTWLEDASAGRIEL